MRVEPTQQDEEVTPTSPWRTALLLAGVAYVAWRFGMTITTVVVILALVFMIFLHELGHYVTAKAAGMKVTEFFIGFGPRLWSFHRGETEYGLKAIPAGAYVRIIGMSNLEDIDPAEEQRTYRSKPYWRRMSVALAGSTMHFVIAIVLAFSIYAGFGIQRPVADEWVIGSLVEESPAADAGIELGDRIVEVEGRSFESFDALSVYLQANPGRSVDLVVDRDGREVELTATLAERHPRTGDGVGFLGVGPVFERYETQRWSPVAAFGRAVGDVRTAMWLSVTGLSGFFSPDGISGYIDTVSGSRGGSGGGEPAAESERLTSVFGAGRLAVQAVESSIVDGLSVLFLINVFVGVFNLVPLLPLDGGHVAIATYEKIRSMLRGGRRYHADVAKLLPLTYAVFLVLVLVGITALWVDITDPIDNPFR